MNLKRKSLGGFLLIAVLLLIITSILSSNLFSLGGKGDGTGDYPPPTQEDWIITSDTYVKNENITFERNITIESGGKLTLDDVRLKINASNYGNARIRVKNGGELNIINNSMISEDKTFVNYDFIYENGSRGLILDSTIKDCGWNDGGTFQSTGGILVATDNVLIENSTIEHNYVGIVVISSSPIIMYNEIRDNQKYGIFLLNSSGQIIGNDIAVNPVGVYSLYSDFYLSENVIRDNGDGTRFLYSNISIDGGRITSSSPEDCGTGSCSSTETGKGIYVESSNLTMDGVNISENNDGLTAYNSRLEIQNSTFSDNLGDGIFGTYSEIDLMNNVFSNNSWYGIYWRFTSLEVDDSNIFTQNNGKGRIISKWNVIVNVTDSYGDRVNNAVVYLNGGFDDFTVQYSKNTYLLGTAEMDVAEYEIDNDGTYIDYNPYNITVKKTAPWDGIEYSNSTSMEIGENLAINMSIPLKKPDLKVESIDFSDGPKVGKRVKINIEISNIGDATANDVQVIVTQKDSLGKTLVVNKTNVSIDPSQSLKLSIAWKPELEGETLVKAVIKTTYDEKDGNKENNELETAINVGEKEQPFYEEPYFMAGLTSFLIILVGVSIYILSLKKRIGEV